MKAFTVGKAWILVPALSFVAGVGAALLLTRTVPGFTSPPELEAPTVAVPSSTPSPYTLSTPTPSPSSTPTPPPPTATALPPTPTPTSTFTPSPTPTSTAISLPPAQVGAPPERPAIISRAEWGSLEITEGYIPHTLERITIHHDGAAFYGDTVARLHSLQSGSRNRGWVDIPYHFLIDLEGNIYEGRPVEFVGDTATEYDPTGHALITVLGNYEVQEINEAQLAAIVDLASWLCYEYSIPPQMIRGHKDYAATACPGRNLYRYVADGSIVTAVEERLSVGAP